MHKIWLHESLYSLKQCTSPISPSTIVENIELSSTYLNSYIKTVVEITLLKDNRET